MQVLQAEIHSEKRVKLEDRRPNRTGCVSNMGTVVEMAKR